MYAIRSYYEDKGSDKEARVDVIDLWIEGKQGGRWNADFVLFEVPVVLLVLRIEPQGRAQCQNAIVRQGFEKAPQKLLGMWCIEMFDNIE